MAFASDFSCTCSERADEDEPLEEEEEDMLSKETTDSTLLTGKQDLYVAIEVSEPAATSFTVSTITIFSTFLRVVNEFRETFGKEKFRATPLGKSRISKEIFCEFLQFK